MKKLFYILLFVVSFLFYWGTAQYIDNRTEAEDAYEYATMVESDAHPWLYHPHHLLYGPVMKQAYKGAQALGYSGRAHDFLMLVSSLSAAGSLFFFFQFCYRRYSLRPVSSLMATGLLAVSYGYWRYAAEAEIVLPASLLALVALYYATEAEVKKRAFILAVLFSSAAVLVHIMNAVVVFLAIPCFYLLRRRWKAALLHALITGGICTGLFWVVSNTYTLYSGGGARYGAVNLGSGVKAMVAFSQCVISGDFVLGLRSVRAFLAELFASRMLQEEFYLGARLSRPFVLFSLCNFLLYFLFLVAGFARAFWVWKNMVHQRGRFRLPEGWPALVVALFWMMGYAVLLLGIEPGNPELWVMGLIPCWLLFCGVVLLPLTVDNRLWIPFFMFVLLLIHNGVGGIGLLGDADKNYHFKKAEWIMSHASADDAVVTACDPVFERYLRYHLEGQVIYLYNMTEVQLSADMLPRDGRTIYVMGDVFDPIQSLKVRFPKKTGLISRYADRLRSEVVKIDEDEFGGVYLLNVAEGSRSRPAEQPE